MAYLSSGQYDHDIFVSYAHVDNQSMPPADRGWVTTFSECVKLRLAQKLGRADAFDLWMDHELRGGQPITPHILERVRRSAMLLVVLSPGYIKSNWCKKELETFAGFMAQDPSRRLFIVELDPVDETERPPSLADLKPAKFWRAERISGPPHPLGHLAPDREFYAAMDDLIRDIVSELKELKQGGIKQTASSPAAARGTVFLAEATDDLDELRSNVARYLDQSQIAVLPKDGFSLHPDVFRSTVKEALGKADLFVQLLSGVAGKRPPDLPEGRVHCQLQLAQAAGKPVLQWRSTELETTTVADDAHRALLEAATVHAEGIEDFKREIRRRIDEKHNPPPVPVQTAATILVDMDSPDRPLAEQLLDILDRYSPGYMVPETDLNPREFRKDLKKKLSQCNALILIYGSTTRNWVDGHLMELQKMLTSRSPLRGLAIIEGPPVPKDRLLTKLPNMQVINCRGGLQEAEVKRFLDGLDGRAA